MLRTRYGRYLPHLESDGAIYFVTFRLCDSLPREVVQRLYQEAHPKPAHRTRRYLSPHIDKFLDAGAGECFLKRPDIAKLAARAIGRFAGTRYSLFAWCVMPNHVHVVIQPHGEWALLRILHSWKSFTATKSNRILQRTGAFWQDEYFDHLVRDGNAFSRIVRYVLENPAKAGLHDWPWVGTEPWRS